MSLRAVLVGDVHVLLAVEEDVRDEVALHRLLVRLVLMTQVQPFRT
jgi:hypothetical protein